MLPNRGGRARGHGRSHIVVAFWAICAHVLVTYAGLRVWDLVQHQLAEFSVRTLLYQTAVLLVEILYGVASLAYLGLSWSSPKHRNSRALEYTPDALITVFFATDENADTIVASVIAHTSAVRPPRIPIKFIVIVQAYTEAVQQARDRIAQLVHNVTFLDYQQLADHEPGTALLGDIVPIVETIAVPRRMTMSQALYLCLSGINRKHSLDNAIVCVTDASVLIDTKHHYKYMVSKLGSKGVGMVSFPCVPKNELAVADLMDLSGQRLQQVVLPALQTSGSCVVSHTCFAARGPTLLQSLRQMELDNASSRTLAWLPFYNRNPDDAAKRTAPVMSGPTASILNHQAGHARLASALFPIIETWDIGSFLGRQFGTKWTWSSAFTVPHIMYRCTIFLEATLLLIISMCAWNNRSPASAASLPVACAFAVHYSLVVLSGMLTSSGFKFSMIRTMLAARTLLPFLISVYCFQWSRFGVDRRGHFRSVGDITTAPLWKLKGKGSDSSMMNDTVLVKVAWGDGSTDDPDGSNGSRQSSNNELFDAPVPDEKMLRSWSSQGFSSNIVDLGALADAPGRRHSRTSSHGAGTGHTPRGPTSPGHRRTPVLSAFKRTSTSGISSQLSDASRASASPRQMSSHALPISSDAHSRQSLPAALPPHWRSDFARRSKNPQPLGEAIQEEEMQEIQAIPPQEGTQDAGLQQLPSLWNDNPQVNARDGTTTDDQPRAVPAAPLLSTMPKQVSLTSADLLSTTSSMLAPVGLPPDSSPAVGSTRPMMWYNGQWNASQNSSCLIADTSAIRRTSQAATSVKIGHPIGEAESVKGSEGGSSMLAGNHTHEHDLARASADGGPASQVPKMTSTFDTPTVFNVEEGERTGHIAEGMMDTAATTTADEGDIAANTGLMHMDCNRTGEGLVNGLSLPRMLLAITIAVLMLAFTTAVLITILVRVTSSSTMRGYTALERIAGDPWGAATVCLCVFTMIPNIILLSNACLPRMLNRALVHNRVSGTLLLSLSAAALLAVPTVHIFSGIAVSSNFSRSVNLPSVPLDGLARASIAFLQQSMAAPEYAVAAVEPVHPTMDAGVINPDNNRSMAGGWFTGPGLAKVTLPQAVLVCDLALTVWAEHSALRDMGTLDAVVEQLVYGLDYLLNATSADGSVVVSSVADSLAPEPESAWLGPYDLDAATRTLSTVGRGQPGTEVYALVSAAFASGAVALEATNSTSTMPQKDYLALLRTRARSVFSHADRPATSYSALAGNLSAVWPASAGSTIDKQLYAAAWMTVLEPANEAMGSRLNYYYTYSEQEHDWTYCSVDVDSFWVASNVVLAQSRPFKRRYNIHVERCINLWVNGQAIHAHEADQWRTLSPEGLMLLRRTSTQNTTDDGTVEGPRPLPLAVRAMSFIAVYSAGRLEEMALQDRPLRAAACFTMQQLRILMGYNPDRFSYVVGVGANSASWPRRPRSRVASCPAGRACPPGNLVSQEDNLFQATGALVNGPTWDGMYVDSRTVVENSGTSVLNTSPLLLLAAAHHHMGLRPQDCVALGNGVRLPNDLWNSFVDLSV